MSEPQAAPRFDLSFLSGYPRRVAEGARAFSERCRQATAAMGRAEDRFHMIALVVIILGGIGLRVALLSRPMDYDETTTFLKFAIRPFSEALSDYSIPNNHLLNTALIRVSYLLFGVHPWVVRLPALIAGVLVIPATYAAGRTFYNKNAGLLAAALAAASALLVGYSLSGRGYSMVALMFMIALVLARMLKTEWNAFAALLLAVDGALMIYAVPIGVYAMAVTLAWLGLSMLIERRAAITGAMIADGVFALGALGALTLALYAPVFLNSGVAAVTQNTYVRPLPWPAMAAGYQEGLPELWQAWVASLPTPAVWLVAAGFVGALVFHRRLGRDLLPVAMVAVPVLAAIVLIQRVVPGMRVWLFLLPVFLMTTSAGIAGGIDRLLRAARPAWVTPAVSLLAAAGLGWLAYADAYTTIWDQGAIYNAAEPIALAIGPEMTPDDAILSLSKDYPSIRFYLYEHFGDRALQFVNWTQIARGAKPEHLYIVLLWQDGQPEAPPERALKARGLKPAEYEIGQTPQLFGGVALYSAQRKP